MPYSVSDTLNKLRKQFTDQLPEKLNVMRNHIQHLDLNKWTKADVEVLHRLIHGLTGSAGTFGMHSVSNSARFLQNRITVLLKATSAPTQEDWHSICTDFDRLDKLARIQLETNAPSLKPHSVTPRLNHAPLIHVV